MTTIQCQNAFAFIAHLDGGNYDALADLLTGNFTHRFLPASTGGLGMAVRDKGQVLEFINDLPNFIQKFNFQTPEEVITAKDVVIFHTRSNGRTVSGRPWTNEYIYIFHFEGDKISSIKEFLDSKFTTEGLALEMNEALKAKAAQVCV